jgi:hypothetical protein
MTETEPQLALTEATQTDKKTAGVFLDTLSNLAYKEIKKNGDLLRSQLATPCFANSACDRSRDTVDFARAPGL